ANHAKARLRRFPRPDLYFRRLDGWKVLEISGPWFERRVCELAVAKLCLQQSHSAVPRTAEYLRIRFLTGYAAEPVLSLQARVRDEHRRGLATDGALLAHVSAA